MLRAPLLLLLALCSFAQDESVESIDTFSSDERAEIEKSSETHEFEAEVSRLMDIIIHSLYSNREIFLRELISNAADATDKIRFQALTDASLIGDEELSIKIVADKEAKTLTITDMGIGMTKDDLLNNLGTVAKSGTTEFLDAATKSGEQDALSLIGQFGVGFYSVYLVADKVTVCSKHDGADQYVWESTANSVFSVAKDPRGNTLGRGTSITLYMKEDAAEFLEESTLESIVLKYSKFIELPIMMAKTKSVTEEEPLSDEELDEIEAEEAAEEAAAKAAEEDGEDLEVSEEDDEDKPEPRSKFRTVTKEVTEFTRLNNVKPIWIRDPSDVTEEEYASFYGSMSDKITDTAMEKVHFSASGAEVSFKALLYIQDKGDQAKYSEMFKAKTTGVKLYVRKVLISDEFDEFLPKYMDSFVKGVVDSDDLPLNVSRETLAQSRVLKVIAKKLQRKVLDLLRKIAEADNEEEAAEEAEVDQQEDDAEEKESLYDKFWQSHGQAIKYGVIEDRKNKAKLSKLLRYQTSKSDEKFVSLETYVERMPEDQSSIYFYNCENLEKCAASPFVEKVTKKGYEVVWMMDVIDEYITSHLTEYDGVTLQSVVKDNMKLDKEEKKAFKQLKEEYKPVVTWLKETLSNRVMEIKVSNKLDQTPCVVSSASYGWTANMERIMKAQTLHNSGAGAVNTPKTLEINPRHPIMKAFKDAIENGSADTEEIQGLASLMLDGALVNSGFSVDDVEKFTKRISNVLAESLGVDAEAVAEEEAEDPEEEETEEEEEEEEEEELEDIEDMPEHTEL